MKKRFFAAFIFVLIICSVLLLAACNESEYESGGGILYEQVGNTYTVVGYDGISGHVVIPETFNGLKVRRIDSGAFRGNDKIQSVKITSAETLIYENTFMNCKNLKKVTFPEGIKAIPANIFYGCKSLAKVNIPVTVEEIEWNAFYGCASLKKMVIPDSVTKINYSAFENCDKLSNISIGDNVTFIGKNILSGTAYARNNYEDNGLYVGKYLVGVEAIPPSTSDEDATFKVREGTLLICAQAFENSEIRSIGLPESLKYIGYNCFFGSKLRSVELPSGLSGIGESAFKESALRSVTISEGIEEISSECFMDCDELEEIVLPSSVRIVRYGAFEECSNLRSVQLNEGLKEMGSQVFKGCISLESISIPSGITEITGGTFSDCTKLSEVKIPESVTSIGYRGFYGCVSLNTIELHDYIEHIGEDAFSGTRCLARNYSNGSAYIGKYLICAERITDERYTVKSGTLLMAEGAFEKEQTLKEVILPEGFLHISNYAFSNCSSLEKIAIPSTLKTIGHQAFNDCGALKEIYLPDSLNFIGILAFDECVSLKKISIPGGVSEIMNMAFSGCVNLESVELGEGVSAIGESVFFRCAALKGIVLPESMKKIGKQAFDFCEGIETIHIPRNVESVGRGAFAYCSSLNEITLSPENKNLVIEGNCLIELSTKTLVAAFGDCDIPLDDRIERIYSSSLQTAPNMKSITISRYIKNVIFIEGIDAYSHMLMLCPDIESITVEEGHPYYYSDGNCVIDKWTGEIVIGCGGSIIPNDEKVNVITDYAFYYCKNLKSITIPKNIKKIESAAFNGCNNLTDIYYDGTKAEWDAVISGSYWNAFGSKNCVLHCSDGDFEVEYKEVAYF